MHQYYTLDDVAYMYSVHKNTVRGWIRSGKLEACRPGGRMIRISARALEVLSEPMRNTPHRR